jgi:hypothetical protein
MFDGFRSRWTMLILASFIYAVKILNKFSLTVSSQSFPNFIIFYRSPLGQFFIAMQTCFGVSTIDM